MVSSPAALIFWKLRPPVPRRVLDWFARFDDGTGLPAASAEEVRLGRILAAIASVWFALVAFWELGAPFGSGHYAASAAVGLAGENMLRFRTLLPVTDVPLGVPTVVDCSCSHPFGAFWTAAFFRALLGHHDFVCRLPAALISTLSPPVLYALGRSLWSPLAGGVVALAFTLTPIALAFANLNALEVPTSFGACVAALAYLRFLQSGRRRFVALCLAAMLYASNSDFPGLVFSTELLLLVFFRVFVRSSRLDATRFRRGAHLFAWSVLLLGAWVAAYAAVLAYVGKLDALFAPGRARSLGDERSFAEVLAARRYWNLLMFTPLAIFAGKLGAVVSAARCVLRRSELELVPLLFLGMALFQYLVFWRNADAHAFGPYYFAACFALGLGAIAQSGAEALRRVTARPRLALAAFALCSLLPLLMARDAVATLVYARKAGGRFDETGVFPQPDKDKVAALELLRARAVPGDVVTLNVYMRKAPWVPWVLGQPTKIDGASQFRGDERWYVSDGRFSEGTRLRQLVGGNETVVVGPFWIFDRRGVHGAPIEGFGVVRREPNLFERYFVSSTHALREVEPDPYVTWELRATLFQAPNPPPAQKPVTLEQVRVAYNIAIDQGDTDGAAALRKRLLDGVDTQVATLYADGTKLLGARLERGASDVLTLYFESSGPDDQRFAIRARVEAPMPGSLVPADPLERDVGLPTTIPRNAWRPRFIYSSVTELVKRPGRERFVGLWLNTTSATLPLKTQSGASEVTLLVLP